MLLNRFSLVSTLLLTFFTSLTLAQKALLKGYAAEYCTGMYSKQDWSGPVEPFIKVDLKSVDQLNPATNNASVSIIVFEYRDFDGVGVADSTGFIHYVCTEAMVEEGYCKSSELYQYVYNTTYPSKSVIKTALLTDLGTNDFSYHVLNTGYYCVAAYNPSWTDTENDFKIIVNFHNSFGNLAASEIPKLPLYGLLAVVYAVCLSVYLFQVYKHRTELLLLQKYLAGFFILLTVENILTWSLYDVQNNNKSYPLPGGIKFYVVVVSIFNSVKISGSLFLLTIISLGYGVVYPKLQRKLMNKVKILTAAHFVFNTVYTVLSYLSQQAQPDAGTTVDSKSSSVMDSNSWLLMMLLAPVILLLFVYYFVILSSLKNTTKLLRENRQVVKLKMYSKLFKLIFVSLLLLIFAFVISTILIFNDSLTESIERFWKVNDVLTDFWPSCLYFIVFIGIAVIWRPTDTSYLLAASSQLPTAANGADLENNDDDDPPPIYSNMDQFGNEFEFDDLRSLDEDDTPPAHSTSDNPFADPQDTGVDFDRELEEQKKKLQQQNNDSFLIDDDDEDQDDHQGHKFIGKSD